MKDYGPLTHGKSILKGFIAGTFLAGNIINPFGLFFQSVLFIIGLLILIDSYIPCGGEGTYISTTSISAVFGALAVYFVTLSGSSVNYMIFIAIIAALLYFFKFIHLKKGNIP